MIAEQYGDDQSERRSGQRLGVEGLTGNGRANALAQSVDDEINRDARRQPKERDDGPVDEQIPNAPNADRRQSRACQTRPILADKLKNSLHIDRTKRSRSLVCGGAGAGLNDRRSVKLRSVERHVRRGVAFFLRHFEALFSLNLRRFWALGEGY